MARWFLTCGAYFAGQSLATPVVCETLGAKLDVPGAFRLLGISWKVPCCPAAAPSSYWRRAFDKPRFNPDISYLLQARGSPSDSPEADLGILHVAAPAALKLLLLGSLTGPSSLLALTL